MSAQADGKEDAVKLNAEDRVGLDWYADIVGLSEGAKLEAESVVRTFRDAQERGHAVQMIDGLYPPKLEQKAAMSAGEWQGNVEAGSPS